MLGLYCERAFRPGLLAEPLNAASNLAFFIAAVLCLRHWLASDRRDLPGLFLILVLLAIGIGSTAFHTWPNRLTVLMDVIPIGVFIFFAFGLAMVRCLALPVWIATAGALLFAGLSLLIAPRLAPLLPPGMAGYLPPLLALPAVAATTRARSGTGDTSRLRWQAKALFTASGLFALSLLLRTLDRPLCALLPTGTHFLWHILNAVVLWRVLTALLPPRAASATGP
jgi:hypothetical protein